MRAYAFIACVIAMVFAGCATHIDAVAVNDAVLADAKARSAHYCKQYEEGCEIEVGRSSHGGWVAWVIPYLHAEDGKRVYGIDVDDFYMYDSRGRFESSLRGY